VSVHGLTSHSTHNKFHLSD